MYVEKNPLIVLNGMRFNDVKQLVEFMYRGEVRVQSEDIDSLLCLAESLQVKGLCNVRTKQLDGNVILPEENTSNKRKLSKSEESTTDSSPKDKRTVSVKNKKFMEVTEKCVRFRNQGNLALLQKVYLKKT